MTQGFQVFADNNGNLWVADGYVSQLKTGVLLAVGSGGGFSPVLAATRDVFTPANATFGGTFVGGSGRNILSFGLSGSGSGPVLPVGIWRPTRPGIYVLGSFTLTVSGSSAATISDGTNTVANLTTGGTAPVGNYVATTYGQTTYNGGAAFTLAVTAEPGGPGSIPGYTASVSGGTAYTGGFTATTTVAAQGATDANWTVTVNSDGSADLKHSGTIIASRYAASNCDASGVYEANTPGMSAYNAGAAWRAYLQAVPVAPRAGFVYLTATETAGVLSGVAGPFFATALPAGSSTVFQVPLAQSDGLGGLVQLHAGLLLWDSFSMGGQKYVHGGNGGLRSLRTRMDRGQSAALLIIGDSTGAGSGAWPRKLAALLGAAYPHHRIEVRDWDNANTKYNLTVVQDGGGERQHWEFPTGVANTPFYNNFEKRAGIATVGRYLGYEFEICAPTSGLLTTSGAVGNPIASVGAGGWAGADPDKSWVELGPWGNLTLYYFDSSGTPVFHYDRYTTPGLPTAGRLNTAGNYVRYRVLLDTANGANWNMSAYYSTDQGCSWTYVGTNSGTKDTSADVFGTLTGCNIGANNGGHPEGYHISYFNILTGANYEPVLPCRVDVPGMVPGASVNDAVLAGNPTLYIDNVSITGAGLASTTGFTTSLASAAYLAFPDRCHDAVVLNTSHNDVGLGEHAWAHYADALVALVQSRLPTAAGSAVTVLTQNPETYTTCNSLRDQHNFRQAKILAYAGIRGYTCIDVYQAFLDDGRPVSGTLVEMTSGSPGVHPSSAGYDLWASTLLNAIRAGTLA